MVILYIVLGIVVGVPVYLIVAIAAQPVIRGLAGIGAWLMGFYAEPFDMRNFNHEVDGGAGSFADDLPYSIRIIFFWFWIFVLFIIAVGFGAVRLLRVMVVGWSKLIRLLWNAGK